MDSIIDVPEDRQTLAERIRSEAELADRAGQFDRLMAIADEVEDAGVLTREELAHEYAIVAHEEKRQLDLESLLEDIFDILPIDAFHHFIGCDWNGHTTTCNRACANLTDRLARVLTKWEAAR